MDAITAQDVLMEDLQGEHREYASIIGIEALLKLCDEFGGLAIYVPSAKKNQETCIISTYTKRVCGRWHK